MGEKHDFYSGQDKPWEDRLGAPQTEKSSKSKDPQLALFLNVIRSHLRQWRI